MCALHRHQHRLLPAIGAALLQHLVHQPPGQAFPLASRINGNIVHIQAVCLMHRRQMGFIQTRRHSALPRAGNGVATQHIRGFCQGCAPTQGLLGQSGMHLAVQHLALFQQMVGMRFGLYGQHRLHVPKMQGRKLKKRHASTLI